MLLYLLQKKFTPSFFCAIIKIKLEVEVKDKNKNAKAISKNARKKALGSIFGILAVLGAGCYCAKNFMINPTDSIETGIYRNALINNFSKGHYVSYKPEAKFQKYIGANYNLKEKKKEITVLKKIAASEGDVVEIKNYDIYINGEKAGKVIKLKGLTENLPDSKKILSKDEYFLMGETPDSFDSRYFGIVKKKDIISEIKLVVSGKSLETAMGRIKVNKS